MSLVIRHRSHFLLFAAVACWTTHAAAQFRPQPVGPPRPGHVDPIDPRFHAIQNVLLRDGASSPYLTGRSDTRTHGLVAVLRFSEPLRTDEQIEMRSAGIEFTHDAMGRAVRVGAVYRAFVPFDALPLLRQHNDLVRAEVAWRPIRPRPLEVVATDLGAAAASQMPTTLRGGKGVLIADIDSGVDVLHPHLFYADGGAFEWLDTNADGRLTVGIDHIDLDGDGEGGFNEVARLLPAVTYTAENGPVHDNLFAPARDWLYIDANEDRQRNAGRSAGFTEFDAAYGEPLFVADDANRNGVLDAGERVVRLQTSKVVEYVTTERAYVRGVDLIDSSTLDLGLELFHGTAVSSILVGGQHQHARRGIAPHAQLAMYAQQSLGREGGELEALASAIAAGSDVVLHEWTDAFFAPMDGSSNIAAAMDEARRMGIVQVTPVGNLNEAQKHVEIALPAATPTELTFEVDQGFASGPDVFAYSTVYGSLHWTTDTIPSLALRRPSGQVFDLPADGNIVALDAQVSAQATYWRSPRGTNQVNFTIWHADFETSVDVGRWAVQVTPVEPMQLTARIADYYSNWSVGVRWSTPTRDRGTAVHPSTADSAFGVSAYVGRFGTVGSLRDFSGRGPRIDGAHIVDIAGPDDPFAALGVDDMLVEAGFGRAWFTTFGGTSGAGPHVAATIALRKALAPDATPDELEQAVLSAARRNEFTNAAGPDDDFWGAGLLDTWATVYGEPLVPNAPPQVAVAQIGPDLLTASGSQDPDDDELQFRWDLDYDGTWDTDWTSEDTQTVEPGATVRLEVADGRGAAMGLVSYVPAIGADDVGTDAGPNLSRDAGDDAQMEPRPFDSLQPQTCICSSAHRPAPAALFIVVVALLGARRRRPHRSHDDGADCVTCSRGR